MWNRRTFQGALPITNLSQFSYIQVLLKENFCVDHALPSVYHVLERCGLSWISARSKHPNSDPEAQEDFKKNFKKK